MIFARKTHASIRTIADFWLRYERNRAAIIGLGITAMMVFVAIFANPIAPHRALEIIGQQVRPPGGDFIFGSDQLGRDVFSRTIYGIRTSMLVGVLAVAILTTIGATIGALSGYFGGKVDEVLMRLTDLFLVIPTFVLALIITAVFERSVWYVILAIGVVQWTATARLTRALFMSLKERDFVQAAVALGERRSKIIVFEIFPNALAPLLVNATLELANAILMESAISFLGMGDPAAPSLGKLLYEAASLYGIAWWMALFPGVVLFLMIMGINLTGDGLNEALNPRLRA